VEEFTKFYKAFSSGLISAEEYWPLWRTVWDSSANFMSYFDGDITTRDQVLGDLFSHHVHFRANFMTTEENNKLSCLPDLVDIFRGGQQKNIAGWSWTLEREYAEHCARAGATDNRPLLAVVSALPSSAVLAYLEKDGFSELIVDPLAITIETGDHGKVAFERL
tara:strand:- start:113 stop:604 length:492 start_codon:yes stop_codon:yes gene_type:complete